jgi:hypothetical protein
MRNVRIINVELAEAKVAQISDEVIHVMIGLFSRRSLVEATLAGEDPVEASGWAIDWDGR